MLEIIAIGTTISSLAVLDKKGILSVNTNAIKIILSVYLIKIGYENINKILETFLLKP